MAMKKKTAKKSHRRGKKASTRASKRTAGRPKKTARGTKPAARKIAKKAPAKKAGLAASPAGEVYGEEGWREEELSAAEMDADVPKPDEREAEPARTGVEEDDDETEW